MKTSDKTKGRWVLCPFCDYRMHVAKVERVSKTLTVRNYACTNIHTENPCGAIIKYTETPLMVLSPPGQNHNGVDIPMKVNPPKRAALKAVSK